ncbi:hypothetical protein H2200_013584 [Cladophialophora chaetospira]|uniref:Glutamine repeat protein-1 n=1 Tax=Cladophialophora chaetospira TaxID=386627 RepID=A0AA38WVP0_9EURO|nr:hypothetical protein H2200_013584 [Cladophialophora chaetospira]
MNNPALPLYVPQNAGPYAYSNQHPNAAYPPGTTFDQHGAQAPFQPGVIPNHVQRASSHPQQPQQHIPPHLYQQQLAQIGAGSRPQSRSSYSPQSQGHPSNGSTPTPLSQGTPPNPNRSQLQSVPSLGQNLPPTSAPLEVHIPANMTSQGQSNPTLAQQAQIQNAAQAARAISQQQQAQHTSQAKQAGANGAAGPQSPARERERVTVLLEINTHLLQEVVSLQAQGKAGTTPTQGQQSPTSPTSASDPTNAITNSPGEPPKSAGGTPQAAKPPSQEYADCMRRLQANLSYLAAIADAKKKANGALPAGPAIMIAPPHLPQVTDLYKKLNSLFPEAASSSINKAMAQAAAQSQIAAKPQQSVTTSGPTQS